MEKTLLFTKSAIILSIMIWKHALMVLLKPDETWKKLAERPLPIGLVIACLIIPLSVITSIVRFSNHEILEVNLYAGTLIYVIVIVLSLAMGSYMIWRLTPGFLSVSTYKRVFNLVCYSYIPVFPAYIIASMHGKLEIIKLTGLFSVYIFWKGLSYMTKTPDERKTGLTFISAIIVTGIGYLLSVLLNLHFF